MDGVMYHEISANNVLHTLSIQELSLLARQLHSTVRITETSPNSSKWRKTSRKLSASFVTESCIRVWASRLGIKPTRLLASYEPETLKFAHLVELILRRYPQVRVYSAFQGLYDSVGVHGCQALDIMTEALRDEELRPVPKERAILESFFTQLGMFSFDRAKDYVEKEKDSSKSAGAIWASLLAALAHLAAAEKAYHNMTFLGQKLGGQSFFSRKDSIRTIYTSLHNELKKVVSMGRHPPGGSSPYLEELLSHLSEQLCHFTHARMETADLYEKMHTLGSQKTVNSEELVSTLESIMEKYSSRYSEECWSRKCLYLIQIPIRKYVDVHLRCVMAETYDIQQDGCQRLVCRGDDVSASRMGGRKYGRNEPFRRAADVNDWLKGVTEHVGVAKDHSVKEAAESAGVWKRTLIRVYQQWENPSLQGILLGIVPGKASTTSGPPDQYFDAVWLA
ncbi:hypothetical protein NFI96_004233 [Prochilodus magdalenae]|nr:hypothetical protein NFI96_004233 [Prochilodus magdalenae]